ncbi:alpha/beta hydrolase [Acuticoccus sp. M5D2P5]|uniref:alpha/beta fold hydrolase n=1 Tax=Acuticoccus kalidii TaxID=2910977 RepID=UPI001F435440|nr:alpha/beta hydrolase [Acuticoccus kalidii]MCF3934127.1 alpha/beta hydrolase [Acuticoccus kalidii]
MELTINAVALAGAALLALTTALPAKSEPIRNVVIVHGALVDGSGWRGVYDRLTDRGYNVTIVQPPMTTLADDVAATHRVLELQDGPSVLVGHSYGGMIITEAGTTDDVAGLVYIAAFQPDEGETLAGLAGETPPATTGIKATSDGFLYLDPAVFAADFAADLPAADAEFLAHSQVFPATITFETKISNPAWKTKPSWALIPGKDRAINPDLMREMAKRAGSKIEEIDASHAVFISQPAAVVAMIEDAANALAD